MITEGNVYSPNNIYLDDSYKAIKLFKDKSVDCIYIDVPYKYILGGVGRSELGSRVAKMNDELKDLNIVNGFDMNILRECIRIMKKINIFIWFSKLQMRDILNLFADYNCNFEILFWGKTNSLPRTNNTWLGDTEMCFHFRESGVPLNDGYDLKSKFYISSVNKADKKLFKHPTIKPLDLVRRHLLHATQPNDLVVDFFAGSGTTGVACQQINRQWIMFEFSEEMYLIAKERLQGKLFNDSKYLEQLTLF